LEGGQRRPDLEYPDDEWYYYQMADRFGWTPEQVDNLPAKQAEWLLAIAATVEQIKVDRLGN